MNTKEEINQIFNNLFEDILIPYNKLYNDTMIVSGGYIRDTLLNKPVNDVDIYIPFSSWAYAMEFFNQGDRQMGEYWANPNSEKHHIYEHLLIASVTWFPFKNYNINLICMSFGFKLTKKNLNNLHAIGLSQCSLDINGLEVSDLFINDVTDERMTLTRLDWNYEQTLKYFMKLYAKYEYPLRIVKTD